MHAVRCSFRHTSYFPRGMITSRKLLRYEPSGPLRSSGTSLLSVPRVRSIHVLELCYTNKLALPSKLESRRGQNQGMQKQSRGPSKVLDAWGFHFGVILHIHQISNTVGIFLCTNIMHPLLTFLCSAKMFSCSLFT